MILLKGIKICDENNSDQNIIKFGKQTEFANDIELEKYRVKLEEMIPGKRVFTIHIEK